MMQLWRNWNCRCFWDPNFENEQRSGWLSRNINFELGCYEIRTVSKIAVYITAYNTLKMGSSFVFKFNGKIGTPSLAEASYKYEE
jgi:hypothetical protein